MAVNVGDMLQRLTNNRLPSTTHRVRNPDAGGASVARYSMPFFLHFRSDYVIETLESCIDASHTHLYTAPITADDYLQKRLRERSAEHSVGKACVNKCKVRWAPYH